MIQKISAHLVILVVLLSFAHLAAAKRLPYTAYIGQRPATAQVATGYERPQAANAMPEVMAKPVSPRMVLFGLAALICSRRAPRTELFSAK